MFSYMKAIAFYAFRSLDMANPYQITPLPIILILRDTRIHVGAPHCRNNTSYIEVPVNNFLSIITVLGIPYVNPDDSYVQSRGDLDNAWF